MVKPGSAHCSLTLTPWRSILYLRFGVRSDSSAGTILNLEVSSMKSKTCTGVVRVALTLPQHGVLAQTSAPTQFSGVINDYSPTTSSPMGPWEMRGPWTLTLNQDYQQGRFFGDLTMELSDYTRNSSNIDSTSGPRLAECSTLTISRSWAAPSRKSRLAGFELSGPVTITKDGSPAPFAASTLLVDITGGTERRVFEHHVAVPRRGDGSLRVAIDPWRG